jgi:hypothetical protein
VSLDLDIEVLSNPSSRANFDELFKADMATLLGIDPSRIQVSGLSGGSVIVAFMILPAADGTSYATADLEATFSSGAVSLAGADASNLSATTSAVDLAACLQVCLAFRTTTATPGPHAFDAPLGSTALEGSYRWPRDA